MTDRLTGNANNTVKHNLEQYFQVTSPIHISREIETNVNKFSYQPIYPPTDRTHHKEEQGLDLSNNVYIITRKTTDNIVNILISHNMYISR